MRWGVAGVLEECESFVDLMPQTNLSFSMVSFMCIADLVEQQAH